MKKFDLKSGGPVDYSPGERTMFQLLTKKPSGQTTKELAGHYYKGRKTPFNGNKSVVDVLRRLQRKAKANREPFRILNTERSGPIPMLFWLED